MTKQQLHWRLSRKVCRIEKVINSHNVPPNSENCHIVKWMCLAISEDHRYVKVLELKG